MTKGPGRETPQDGISAAMGCQTPPLREALASARRLVPPSVVRIADGGPFGVIHVAMWRKRS